MTSTPHEPKQEAGPQVQHPPWCGRQAVECTGNTHRSAEIGVALDEHAGCEVRARLWSGSWNGEQRVFVDLDFISAGTLDEAWAAWERLEVAAGATGNEQAHRLSTEAPEPGAPPGASEKRVVRLNPLDSTYVSDPHGHSLSVEQAEILAGVLGYLVRAARDGDVEALRAGARLI